MAMGNSGDQDDAWPGITSYPRGLVDVAVGARATLSENGIWKLHLGFATNHAPVTDQDQAFNAVKPLCGHRRGRRQVETFSGDDRVPLRVRNLRERGRSWARERADGDHELHGSGHRAHLLGRVPLLKYLLTIVVDTTIVPTMAGVVAKELKQKSAFASLEQEVFLALRIATARVLEPWAAFLKTTAGLTNSQYNVLRILRGSHPPG